MYSMNRNMTSTLNIVTTAIEKLVWNNTEALSFVKMTVTLDIFSK